MEKITLLTNGQIAGNKTPIRDNPLTYLGSGVAIENDYTLASFFKMLETYIEFQQLSHFTKALIRIADEAGGVNYLSEEIDFLQLSKIVEMIGFPKEPRLEIYPSLKGMKQDKPGDSPSDDSSEDPLGYTTVDLKFLHLEGLLNHKLKLGSLKHIVFGEKQDVFMFDTVYTLFELIEGITWELSFNFNPLECKIRR